MLQTESLSKLLSESLKKDPTFSSVLAFTTRGSVLGTSSALHTTDSRIYATSLSQVFAVYSSLPSVKPLENVVLEFESRIVVLSPLQKGILLALVSEILEDDAVIENGEGPGLEGEGLDYDSRSKARKDIITSKAVNLSDSIKRDVKRLKLSAANLC